MRNSTLAILPILLLFPFSAKALNADWQNFAMRQNNFVLVGPQKIFTVTAAQTDSWLAVSSLPIASNTLYQAPTYAKLLNQSFGHPASSSASLSPTAFHYSPEKVYDFISGVAKTISTNPIEPKLKIVGSVATEFVPPQNGQAIDAYQSSWAVLKALEHNQASSSLDVIITQPSQSLSDINNLGIRELIAQGVSNFKGSPQNRRHNITVGVEKFKGLIIPKDMEFSFNKYLGPVDGEHGFLPELVIKKEGTVPEFGGGLCQVSSTAFRAAMAAGLPITQRKNHAYAVSYYSPQGTDATIYPGVVDLKFVNDTPGTILVWPYFKDNNTLAFDFYGTKDSRQVVLQKPVQWDIKEDGSMKASWTRIVINGQNTSTSTFKSVYLPPALFHKTETFVSATGTPQNENQIQ